MAHSLPPFRLWSSTASSTPLVPVRLDGGPTIWCKLEFLNPSGSTKDRIASFILAKAWRTGRVSEGSRVVEASSGSTSIAMAMVCAQLGLKFTAVMPEGVSSERSKIIRAYGGKVTHSPRDQGIFGALDEARRLADETGAFLPLQFENPDNAEAHRVCTAREIILDLPGGTPDAVVSGVGTGGTILGLYLGFRDHGCAAKPYVARPIRRDESGVFSDAECASASSMIPGVVEQVSKLYKPEELEGLEILDIHDRAALECARQLIRCGFPVGPSSGLNFLAALEAAAQLGDAARVVTVFPDRMERYFSTALFDET